jgi:uncharacterized metal-binding protein
MKTNQDLADYSCAAHIKVDWSTALDASSVSRSVLGLGKCDSSMAEKVLEGTALLAT